MKELRNDLIKFVAVALIGGLSVVVADYYADFRDVEGKELQAEKFVDYRVLVDSLFKVRSEEEKRNRAKERRAFGMIKDQIKQDKELTVEAIEIAEDTLFSLSVNESDSIRNILLSE